MSWTRWGCAGSIVASIVACVLFAVERNINAAFWAVINAINCGSLWLVQGTLERKERELKQAREIIYKQKNGVV